MPINPTFINDLTEQKTVDRQITPSDVLSIGANDTLTALSLYQEYLEQQLGGHQSMWMAAYRGKYGRDFWQTELMDGWKVIDISTPLRGHLDYETEKALYFEAAKQTGLDPHAKFTIAHAGSTRVHTTNQVIGDVDWETHWMRERLTSQGAGERIVGVLNLGPITESVFIVDRPVDSPRFDDTDAEKLMQALTDCHRLHYWLMLERGLTSGATRPFSPKERLVVQQLLTPNNESEIADRLELSPGVLHNYVTDIYRTMSVNSRHEFVQLWLSNL
ncbi:MAG: LuxR C-terminal-related transcriptional regulator [Pseudomonadota bacterium]